MKIVDRKAFLALPPGTVFSTYKPCYMDAICIKGDTVLPMTDAGAGDFDVCRLEHALSYVEEEFSDICFKHLEKGKSVPMEFNTYHRDGLFDVAQQFAVWEPADIQALIARLQQCLQQSRPLWSMNLKTGEMTRL